MKKSLFLFNTILVSIIVLLSSCKNCDKKNKNFIDDIRQNLKININTEPQTLDPRKARCLNDINSIKMLMEGLTRVNKEGIVENALAEAIKISEDKKTYTFTIKKAFWSNGDEISANDFIYSWKSSLMPEFASACAFQLYVIKNAKAVKDGLLPASMLCVSAIDNKTIEIELEHNTPYLLELLSMPIFFPINSKVDQINPNWANEGETYVCSGPFSIKDWQHNNVINCEKNKKYWDEKTVQLNNISLLMVDADTGFKMFETNQLNWEGSPFSSISLDSLENLKETKKINTLPFNGTYFIRINTEKFPFNSSSIRKALSYTINRKEIIEHILQGSQTSATGILPTTMNSNNNSCFNDFDIETAKNLFRDGLSELKLKDFPKISLLYTNSETSHRIAQAIQHQWSENLGINVELISLESKVFFDKISKQDYQLSCGSWIADFNDPINFLSVFSSKENGTNNTGWENEKYTTLLKNSTYTLDNKERLDMLLESEKILMDEMPVMPIFHYSMTYVKDDKVKDFVLTSSGNIDFKWAYIEK